MTKANLVEEVARVVECSRREAATIVETVFESVAKALREGRRVEIGVRVAMEQKTVIRTEPRGGLLLTPPFSANSRLDESSFVSNCNRPARWSHLLQELPSSPSPSVGYGRPLPLNTTFWSVATRRQFTGVPQRAGTAPAENLFAQAPPDTATHHTACRLASSDTRSESI